MGTRHLYWILTGSSFAVDYKNNKYCMIGRQAYVNISNLAYFMLFFSNQMFARSQLAFSAFSL
jgi:hypothetical protein